MSGQLARLGSRAALIRQIVAGTAGPAAAMRAIRVASRGRSSGPQGEPVEIAMKGLGGAPVWVRPGSSDLVNALAYYAYRSHLPPDSIGEPRSIVELGSNCGVAMTALGLEFPQARLLGVEPDPGNLEAARRNAARFGDRCRIVQGALWDESCELVVDRGSPHGEHGYAVRREQPGDPADWPRLQATSIDDLLDANADLIGDVVDYMHISVEGSEERLFAAGGRWPERVRSIRVEVHPYFDFTEDRCLELLGALGYRAWPVPEPPGKWVFAVREH